MAPAAVLLRFGLLLAMLSITAGPAFAHSENGVAIDFVGGFTHPIFGPDHVVAMVAVGLWGAFLGVPAIWLLPVVFPLVMAIAGRTRRSGHAAAWCRNRDSAVSDRSWGHGGVRGKATAMGRSGPGRSLRRLSWPCAWRRAPVGADAIAYSMGFVIATGMLHVSGIAFGALSRWAAGRIAVRTMGAVIVVIGFAYLGYFI